MKKNLVKIICIVLTVSLISGLGMAAAYAAGVKSVPKQEAKSANPDSFTLNSTTDRDIETVYVMTDAEGTADSIIVSDS